MKHMEQVKKKFEYRLHVHIYYNLHLELAKNTMNINAFSLNF